MCQKLTKLQTQQLIQIESTSQLLLYTFLRYWSNTRTNFSFWFDWTLNICVFRLPGCVAQYSHWLQGHFAFSLTDVKFNCWLSSQPSTGRTPTVVMSKCYCSSDWKISRCSLISSLTSQCPGEVDNNYIIAHCDHPLLCNEESLILSLLTWVNKSTSFSSMSFFSLLLLIFVFHWGL